MAIYLKIPMATIRNYATNNINSISFCSLVQMMQFRRISLYLRNLKKGNKRVMQFKKIMQQYQHLRIYLFEVRLYATSLCVYLKWFLQTERASAKRLILDGGEVVAIYIIKWSSKFIHIVYILTHKLFGNKWLGWNLINDFIFNIFINVMADNFSSKSRNTFERNITKLIYL